MKITDIEIIPIYPRIAARNEAYKVRFRNINHRTVFKVHTDNGLVGYGDYRCAAPSQASVASFIGRNPFDFINNNLNPGLGGSLYDVMGKYLEACLQADGAKSAGRGFGRGMDPSSFAGAFPRRNPSGCFPRLHDI